MFDAKNGKKVFDRLYEEVLKANDTGLWYESGYSTWECWDYAASNALERWVSTNDDMTDLMAYVVECNPDDVCTVFFDGFHYLLGNMMQNEYEMGE